MQSNIRTYIIKPLQRYYFFNKCMFIPTIYTLNRYEISECRFFCVDKTFSQCLLKNKNRKYCCVNIYIGNNH